MRLEEILKQLDELEAKATKGKWDVLYDGNDPDNGLCDIISDNDGQVILMNARLVDAEFLEAISNSYSLLRAEIDRLQKENAQIKNFQYDVNGRIKLICPKCEGKRVY